MDTAHTDFSTSAVMIVNVLRLWHKKINVEKFEEELAPRTPNFREKMCRNAYQHAAVYPDEAEAVKAMIETS